MPAYYFSIEGMRTGEKSDPATDTLVSLQYQKIKQTTGEPLDVLVICREWESSEKEIVTDLYNTFFRPGIPVTEFIPVGMNLDYAYEMLLSLFRKYQLTPPSSYELYYQRPRIDLRPVIVLLNDGRFVGASLDAFSIKKGEDRHMEKWYSKQEYGRIEHYVREEAARFLKVFQYLSKYKSRLGITVKETTASRKAPRTPAPAAAPASAVPSPIRERPVKPAAETGRPVLRETRPAPAHTSAPHSHEPRDRPASRAAETGKLAPRETRPTRSGSSPSRSPEPRERMAPKAEESGRPALRDRPAPAKKTASRSLLPAPERSAAERKRAPAGRNQLLRHPSAKDAPAKKGPARRR